MERIDHISYEVQKIFSIANLVYVHPILEILLPNLPRLLAEMWDLREKEFHDIPPSDFYLLYGVRYWTPLLNLYMERPPESKTTFDGVLRYALRRKIELDASLMRRLRMHDARG